MNRIAPGFDVEQIRIALDLLPPGIRRRVEHADFLAGVNPLFVDPCAYDAQREKNLDINAHVLWMTCHQDHRPRAQRVPQVVMPVAHGVSFVIHELAHVLDEQIVWDRYQVCPVTRYAEKDPYEAFAEAFRVTYCPPKHNDMVATDPRYVQHYLVDEWTLALFTELEQ